MDYEDMLDRAQSEVTEVRNYNRRFELPDPETTFDGSFTQYRNFDQTAQKLDRDVDEMLTFFQEALATNGSLDDQTASFKGRFSSSDLTDKLSTYFEKYVECDQCGSPDTRYQVESGVEIIYCTACGATQPKPE